MKLIDVIKDKMIFILCQCVLIGLFALVLNLQGASFDAILLICLTAVAIVIISISIESYRKQSYYKRLFSTLEHMDKKQLISEVIEWPEFYEGKMLYDTLKVVTKAMNDEIAQYKCTQDDYHDYIEQWIHEVKLPISCINLICENNSGHVSNSIEEEAKRISAYVDQALYYARSTNVEKDYAIRRVNLDTLIKRVIKSNSKTLINHKTKVKIEKLTYDVLTDAKWLEFIVGQIVSNAIKYRKDDLELTFFGEELTHATILHIKDNGVGIPESDQSRVFDKGFTGSNGRKFGNATGIGLYLCKKLCDKMNLRLYLDSVQGKGTIVSIVFPNDREYLWKENE